MRLIIVIYISILRYLSFVQSNHFLGGTISWKSRNPTTSMIITQSYQWKNSSTNNTWKCLSTNNICDGFQSLKTNHYHVESSKQLNFQSIQILTIENFTENSMFCIAFQNQYWTSVQSSICNSNCNNSQTLKSSIGTCLNLNNRLDNKINTSPVTNFISPIQIPINSIKSITIPIIDPDNDYIRCRWAVNKTLIDECGDICGIVHGSSLDSNTCTLTFDSRGKTVGNIYGVALMIEDFPDSSTINPLSSIPLQFLVEIINNSNCLLKPIIYSNINTFNTISVGQQFNFSLTIIQGCPNTQIIDLYTVSPMNMLRNNLTFIDTETLWKVSQIWIPTDIELGAHVYCAIATDNLKIQSDEYCLKFIVVPFEKSFQIDSRNMGEINIVSNNVSATTTAPPPTVILTVLVPESSNFNSDFSKEDLALALGLSIPLLFIFGCLFVCRCCCQHTALYRSLFSRQNKSLSNVKKTNQTELNENSLNMLEKNKQSTDTLPDYRRQYVNQTPKTNKVRPANTPIEKRFLTRNEASTPKLSTHFEENSTDQMKTTFVSPSSVSFATSEVSFTKIHLLKNSAAPTNQGSILVQAYCHQENQKN